MDSLCRTKKILAETRKVRFVEAINSNSALDGVHYSVVHDGLDVLLLGDLEELFSIGRCCEIFCRGEEEELILYILYRQSVDDDGVDGVGEGGLGPGDGVGRDASVDHAVVGESTVIEGHTQGISFDLRGEGEKIIPP